MGLPSPTLIITPWAGGATSTYRTSPIPTPSQQPNPRASYTDGFPPQTSGATGTPPDIRDFNGALYDATSNILALTAGVDWGFQPALATELAGYPAAAIIATADGSGYWLNASGAANSNNPDTTAAATSGWVPLTQYGLGTVTGLAASNVTLTAPQAAKSIITLAGALTANVQIIFPTWLKKWLVVNKTTGNFTVTCKTSAGTGVLIPQGGSMSVWGDGTNINGSDFIRSSFVASIGGLNVTVKYSIVSGCIVCMTIPATLGNMAGAPDITFQNVPTQLYPATSKAVSADVPWQDDGVGVSVPVFLTIPNAGNWSFNKLTGAFSGGPNTGPQDGLCFTYSLD